MVKNLITGIGGFVASHLADHLLEKGEEVYGTYRWTEDLSRIKHIKNKIKMIPADLLDFVSLFRAIADNKPDYIFHLAAQSYVPDSFTNPIVTIETNTIGTVNLLEAIRLYRDYIDKNYDPVVHVCSSSEYYGKVNENEIPITEKNDVRPGNQYAIGKVGADAAAYFYFNYYGIKTIRTRMFTHTGDRRSMMSAECNFARQIALIEKGLQEPVVKHGNLNSVRTWANVKDAVRAYYLLVRKGKPGEVYNIGGKVNKTIGEMLDYMITLSPMKDKIRKELDPSLVRKVDVNLQIVDYSKFQRDTGWEPVISFEETIKEVLDFWRTNV
ncbi:GDP-mannose 4,6-dehydratase [Candidatus Pacearchaeota archaeon]|nr:GDP-mannose 4,6-dehydratase [Candidatus Pacearchaeota archaeon]